MALVAHTEDESLLFGGVMHEGEVSKKLGLPGILSATEASQIARDITLAKEQAFIIMFVMFQQKKACALFEMLKSRDSRNSRSFATPFNFSR